MTSLVFGLCLILTLLFHNSIAQLVTTDVNNTQGLAQNTTTTEPPTTTSNWWRRTTPIRQTRPNKTPPRPPPPTTERPPRISNGVLISVPLVVLCLTIIAGVGLISFAIRTGGNGMSLFTRTNDQHHGVQRGP